MKKRLISALLVLVLAICVFPVSAFADGYLIASSGAEGIMNQTGTVFYNDMQGRPAARAFPAGSSVRLICDLYSGDYYAHGSFWDPIASYRVETGKTDRTYVSF